MKGCSRVWWILLVGLVCGASDAAAEAPALFREGETWAATFSTGDVLAVRCERTGNGPARGSAYLLVDDAEFTWAIEGDRLELSFEPRRPTTTLRGEVLVFQVRSTGELELLPQGAMRDVAPAEMAGMRLQRNDRSPYDLGRAASSRRAKSPIPPPAPTEIPSSVLTGIARALLRGGRDPVRGIAYWLDDPRLSPSFLEEATDAFLKRVPDGDPLYEFHFAERIARNPSLPTEALRRLFAESPAPRVWEVAAAQPRAPKTWMAEYSERVLRGSWRLQSAALHDPGMPAELIERLAQTGDGRALESLVSHAQATPLALTTAYRRSETEEGARVSWERLAQHPNTPLEILRKMKIVAAKSGFADLLRALAENPSPDLSEDFRREIAAARFDAAVGASGSRMALQGALADPFLPPARMGEWLNAPFPSLRVALARNPALNEEALLALAGDPSEYVSRIARETWRKKYPSRPMPPFPPSAGKRTDLQDETEIREMIYRGEVAAAAAVWRRLPKRLQREFSAVVAWEKSQGPVAPLISFIAEAEEPGGPLAAPLLMSVVRDAPEQIAEMAKRGLVAKVAPYQPLWIAVAEARHEALRELLDAGLSPNCIGDGGTTPLMVAAQLGDLQAVRCLLEHGASRTAKNGFMKTAADLAADALRIEALAALAETPAELGKLAALRRRLVPVTDESWLGVWSNGRDGFSTAGVRFNRDGSCAFSAGFLTFVGAWRATEPDKVAVMPVWPEVVQSQREQDESERLKKLVGEPVFERLSQPTRLRLKLGENFLELFPEQK